jgi:hypothetical protein
MPSIERRVAALEAEEPRWPEPRENLTARERYMRMLNGPVGAIGGPPLDLTPEQVRALIIEGHTLHGPRVTYRARMPLRGVSKPCEQ